MNTTREKMDDAQLAACVAPEDIHCGDYLVILSRTEEYPSFFWCCDTTSMQPHETVRVRFNDRGGVPLKVKAVCLPFVLVEMPNKKPLSLDVRVYQCAKLGRSYAKTAVQAFRAST